MNLKQLEEINLTMKARNNCKETQEIAIIHVKNKLKEIDEKLKELGVYI